MNTDNGGQPEESLSRYGLVIHKSDITPDVLRFRGREALSEPFFWNIEFTTPQAGLLPQQVLMKYASLRMQGGRTVYGIVTRFEWYSTSEDQSHYSVTLSSRLALLSRTRQCRVFLNQSVPEVVEQVLREHGLEGADFNFRLEREYPERELITQWRETDLEFIQRLLSEVGIWWRTEMDSLRGLDVTIFADSQLNYHFDVRLPYREPSGLHDGAQEAVWGVRTWHNAVTGRVQTRDYYYPAATTPLGTTVRVRSTAVTTGEHYRYAEPYREQGDDTDPEPECESGAFYARIHHERELNNSLRVHLFSNAGALTPGMVLEPQGDVIRALKEGVIITLTTFRASRDSRLHVSVWGMPYSERYCYRPPEIPRPEIHGTVPARVESRDPKDTYAWLDEAGRYRVKLDMDREGSESGYSYLWVRLAKLYAGETYGWHTPLLAGTEVSVAFDGGDPDRPYIAHAFHDSAHPDVVNRDNRSRNILRTPAQNELRMEDKRGEEHIHLTTEYGKTQLGEGQLVDGQDKPRGAGFELRTDEYGVIRVAKGLFISADGQQKAAGEVLDRETALKEIDLCLQQIAQLSASADAANALQADIASQSAMFSERLKPLNELIHMQAPDGMAFTSGEHTQLTATKNVAVSAGGDISVGVMGNMTALAGEKLGLFARSGPLSLKSGEGPLEVQAQNGGMQLAAEKKVTLTSVSDISFAGKKRITLIGGGSYLKLEAGKIEYGTPQVYLRKVEKTYLGASKSRQVEFPYLPGKEGIYSRGFILLDDRTNEPAAGIAYRLTLSSGEKVENVSNNKGCTYIMSHKEKHEVELTILRQESLIIG
ncbi:type VI secretion system Vgr family protein [Cronobacter sakazakii]|uniref:type VI secretion system Vgr family protein n=1 Tax=Cronobacter sakazakii TaxID=28141 RepID=UPI000CFA9512|nr:type VI secretion system Vgr family protein [Cronobacter sakazakii]ELY2647835.1 type VI secretion system tip protein VgrG [Cronobacter sakazakii]ELY2668392.1 type VI secretion system tip protein VgrG [Cronobacter sakazakii]ELY3415556.1 type VI secretion system tip protein VgrG [Cronobacter sakazakii]ELY4340333.1 type VI secretion system tip protein VgrG [Cronobacter sakazakii]ELY4373369.1 type VI secretion system tip protein VgrG [Cronobacter sakazakii]